MRLKHLPLTLCLAVFALPVSAADYALGLVAFERGDIATAHREFSLLAEEGHPAAQYSLAMLYLKNVPPEYVRAIPWLEKSARRGLPESQYMLGILSLHGVGTAEDTKQGMQWLTLASEQGNEDAQAQLDKLKQARLQEAESERRKVESERREAAQARDLRAELDQAKASEQSLQKRLSQSKQREKTLASERKTFQKARASDARAQETMRQEQARLEAELEALRSRLADAERARESQPAAKDDVVVAEAARAETVVAEAARAETVVEDAPGEAVVAGKVVEILPDGVLLTEVSRRADGRSQPFPEGFVVFLNLAATDGLSEGQEVAYPAEPATPYRYKYESGATGRIRAYRVIGN